MLQASLSSNGKSEAVIQTFVSCDWSRIHVRSVKLGLFDKFQQPGAIERAGNFMIRRQRRRLEDFESLCCFFGFRKVLLFLLDFIQEFFFIRFFLLQRSIDIGTPGKISAKKGGDSDNGNV